VFLAVNHASTAGSRGNVPDNKNRRLIQRYAYSSKMATARVQPAEAPRILQGKQEMVKPVAGSTSRLCSFSKWQ